MSLHRNIKKQNNIQIHNQLTDWLNNNKLNNCKPVYNKNSTNISNNNDNKSTQLPKQNFLVKSGDPRSDLKGVIKYLN